MAALVAGRNLGVAANPWNLGLRSCQDAALFHSRKTDNLLKGGWRNKSPSDSWTNDNHDSSPDLSAVTRGNIRLLGRWGPCVLEVDVVFIDGTIFDLIYVSRE